MLGDYASQIYGLQTPSDASQEPTKFFGSYLAYSYSQDPANGDKHIQVAAYHNLASPAAQPVYGALALEAIIRELAGDNEITLEFNNKPLGLNFEVYQGASPEASLQFVSFPMIMSVIILGMNVINLTSKF